MSSIKSIIFIVISIGLFLGYIRPEWNHVSELKNKSNQYNSVLLSAKTGKDLRDKLSMQYASISDSDKAILESMIPDTIDPVSKVALMSQVASQFGLTVTEVKISNSNQQQDSSRDKLMVTTTDPYKTTNIGFTITGGYQPFISFLKKLEMNSNIFDVTRLEIGQGRNSGLLEFKLSLNTYSLK